MSTRSTIYYNVPKPGEPSIHVYREMLDDAPDDIHMEIQLPFVCIDIPLPADMQKWIGLLKGESNGR